MSASQILTFQVDPQSSIEVGCCGQTVPLHEISTHFPAISTSRGIGDSAQLHGGLKDVSGICQHARRLEENLVLLIHLQGDTPQGKQFLEKEKDAVESLLRRFLQPDFAPTTWDAAYMTSPSFKRKIWKARVNDILRGYGPKV